MTCGTVPAKPDSVAGLQYALLQAKRYTMASDDILFEVFALRNGVVEVDRAEARSAFFAKPHACLRASPLVKQYGWGLHHDAQGRVATPGIGTAAYRQLAARTDLRIIAGMRSTRKLAYHCGGLQPTLAQARRFQARN
jgi:hypothetical protein